MLYDAENTRAVAQSLKEFYEGRSMPPLVVDPVCVSTSGHTLLAPEAISILVHELIPIAKLITPNKSEAELLLSHLQGNTLDKCSINTLNQAIAGARDLARTCGVSVLLKGGHLSVSVLEMSALLKEVAGNEDTLKISIAWDSAEQNMEILRVRTLTPESELVVDILHECDSGISTVFARPRIETTSTHGTGCTLSAAIASCLANGQSGTYHGLFR